MANEIKYENVSWAEGTPIAGERLATNSFYTGQHKGTPTQDALDGADNDPYLNERNTIRLGTILGDALDENFPTVDDGEGDGEENSEGEGTGDSEGTGDDEGAGTEGAGTGEGT